MINLTGLWKAQSKNGKNYLRANFGSIVIMVFPNENKNGNEKAPDFKIVIAEKKKPEQPQAPSSGSSQSNYNNTAQSIITSDDIPF
jgi:hypothetical protein